VELFTTAKHLKVQEQVLFFHNPDPLVCFSQKRGRQEYFVPCMTETTSQPRLASISPGAIPTRISGSIGVQSGLEQVTSPTRPERMQNCQKNECQGTPFSSVPNWTVQSSRSTATVTAVCTQSMRTLHHRDDTPRKGSRKGIRQEELPVADATSFHSDGGATISGGSRTDLGAVDSRAPSLADARAVAAEATCMKAGSVVSATCWRDIGGVHGAHQTNTGTTAFQRGDKGAHLKQSPLTNARCLPSSGVRDTRACFTSPTRVPNDSTSTGYSTARPMADNRGVAWVSGAVNTAALPEAFWSGGLCARGLCLHRDVAQFSHRVSGAAFAAAARLWEQASPIRDTVAAALALEVLNVRP
jgi:hypothetical protein